MSQFLKARKAPYRQWLASHRYNLRSYRESLKAAEEAAEAEIKTLSRQLNQHPEWKGRIDKLENDLKEVMGERGALAYMHQHFDDTFLVNSTFRQGHGIDQIWAQTDTDGNFIKFIIVEAKGGDSKLKPGQMSWDWIEKDLIKMTQHGDEATKTLAKQLLAAQKKGQIDRLAVRTGRPNGPQRLLKIPD
jgi:hypothetical protein